MEIHMHPDIQELKKQVQLNCHISDAHYAGIYSLCMLLLRLRDYYKWEKGISPWHEPEPADLLQWVEDREAYWEGITDSGFHPLTLGPRSFDPFDMESINRELRPAGLIYGAGYATGMKPSFFLAELISSKTSGGLRIDITGRELARDLYTAPAMRQGNQIFARHSAMLFFLWNQIMEMRPSAKEGLSFALAQYGIELQTIRSSIERLGETLEEIAMREVTCWVHHEIGEAGESVFTGRQWHELVSTYSNTPIEIFARAVKDLLADTHEAGLLAHIVRHGMKSSLGFYISFMRPISRLLFPEIYPAFDCFRTSGDWSCIERVQKLGYTKASGYAEALIAYHDEGQRRGAEWARSEIMSKLLEPLGVIKSLREDSDD